MKLAFATHLLALYGQTRQYVVQAGRAVDKTSLPVGDIERDQPCDDRVRAKITRSNATECCCSCETKQPEVVELEKKNDDLGGYKIVGFVEAEEKGGGYLKGTGQCNKGQGGKGDKPKHIVHPKSLSIDIKLGGNRRRMAPPDDSFPLTRYIAFTNWFGDEERVPVKFEAPDGGWIHGTADAVEAPPNTLYSLAYTNKLWYWDLMRLQNRGGSTKISIAHLNMTVHYDLSINAEEDIQIIDEDDMGILNDGWTEISLDKAAQKGRKNFAKRITSVNYSDMPKCLKLAVQDLGKTGSDGAHLYVQWVDIPWYDFDNPKFNPEDNNLCSEFVSWYYAKADYQLVLFNIFPFPPLTFDFVGVTGTSQMHEAFAIANRLYCFEDGKFKKVTESGRKLKGVNTRSDDSGYQPQPGDFLERRSADEDKPEHSMMVIKWNPPDLDPFHMWVMNGPWPVTIRDVNIDDSNKIFCVGSI